MLVRSRFEPRPVAGGGAGGAQAPPEIFRLELISATKVNGSYSFKVLSIMVRLCTLVLLCNLELCKGTKWYFYSAKNSQQVLNICLLSIEINRSKMDRDASITVPELDLLNFIGFLRGLPV